MSMDSLVAAGPVGLNSETVDLDSRVTDNYAPVRRWREVELSSCVQPSERSGASSVIYQDNLYIFGGYGGGGRLDDICRFDFPTKCWERVEVQGSIPAGRENNGAVVHGSKMYLFGGYSGFTWLNDFLSFDFHTRMWQAVPSGQKGVVPSTRFGYVSSVSEDNMFIFGGYDGSAWLNDMFDFDFRRGLWSNTQVKGFVPSGRSCPSWATHSNSVYLFGGYDGVHRMNDFHQFRMGSRTWCAVRSSGQVPSPRYFHATVPYTSSLFLFGGYSGHERLNDLYEFRIDCNTWFAISADDPPSGRSSLVAQVVHDSLYVFGGYNGSIVLNDFYELRFEPVSIPPSNLVDDLRKLINNPVFADVTFLVENQPVYATRANLAARSEHFRALFYGGMRESSGGADEQIVLPDIAHPVFLLLLEYIYTDQVGDISSELAVHLLIAAERFLLDRLKALSEDIVRKFISLDNCVSIMMTAKAHRAEGLKDICMDFIVSNEEKIKQSPAFRELIQEPTLMYELLMRRKPPK
jgi:N-acetylneuraminic acid mutarotase